MTKIKESTRAIHFKKDKQTLSKVFACNKNVIKTPPKV